MNPTMKPIPAEKQKPFDPKEKPPAPSPLPEPGDEEELAHYDDAIIGRAFRWSAVAFILLAALVGTTVFFLNKKPAAAPPQITQLTARCPSNFTGGDS